MKNLGMLQSTICITILASLLTALLAALKLFVGWWGQSHALVADGVHSVSDVLIDILVIFAAYFGGKKADKNHPYGHGRIETAATFGLAQLLVIVGIGIIYDAGKHLWDSEINTAPNINVLWIAILAIIINEFLFRYTLIVAKKLNSNLLEANAWHSRSDVAVSIIVLLSIGGALLGFPYLDIVGALIVGLMIIKLGGGLAWKSISELVDTGVAENVLEEIKMVIKNIPGVTTLHMLRTRTINNKIFIDVHILVSPYISVSEGHYIGDQVSTSLYNKIPEIGDITVHIDPEDDEIMHSSIHLPHRDTIISQLKQCWANLPGAPDIQDIRLHYLNGKIDVEACLPMQYFDTPDPDKLTHRYKQAVLNLNYIHEVKLWFG